jgi:uncharacterized protein YjbJ (UPF0337 family)
MNKDIFQGKWRQLKGQLKAKWGKLTNDDMSVIEGNHEQLFAIMQQRYGMQREDVERQLKDLVAEGGDRVSTP